VFFDFRNAFTIQLLYRSEVASPGNGDFEFFVGKGFLGWQQENELPKQAPSSTQFG
jgi:hypothetical protein